MDNKKPWQSKTIVLNGIFGLIAFLSIFVPALGGLKDFLNGHAGEVSAVWGVLNVFLRAISKDKISLGE